MSMDTPICDFVNNYIKKRDLRLHMPGHKGIPMLGFEEYDITEIRGADCLSNADGIIRKSEDNASSLFGCHTFYSTEGASQCIRAMMYLTILHSGVKKPLIAAGRNAHKTFISAAVLLDFDVDWLCPDGESYLSCSITPEFLESYFALSARIPNALYLTSPDYLGNMLDICAISAVCRRHGVLLIVDNAHGAYLKFLDKSLHPIDLGADMCCSSAHKTLPVITGGAYLQISKTCDSMITERARAALSMFGSTSPSYLILESLDMANKYLEGYKPCIGRFIPKLSGLKIKLSALGYNISGDEPLKLTIRPKSYGYTGAELAQLIEHSGIVPEFYDPDFLVMMFTPEISDAELDLVLSVLSEIPKKPSVNELPPRFTVPNRIMSPREASFSASETVDVSESAGRVLASAEIGCPPAVPIIICGEEISTSAIECIKYYGIKKCTVVKNI